MAKIRIVCNDTATGEEDCMDVEVPKVTFEHVITAMRARHAKESDCSVAEVDDYSPVAWVKDAKSDTYAFIISVPKAVYFGSFLISGFVYTDFS